ncbi:nucleotidyl transferase [Skermanella stibiiresistens SB22]|uniref:Nucleotidyl transferase n=1 Tax=Skermanella stibiiresistens SB22 TaxID=1385369 RepID=W9HCS3_9PROT|nr:nucleotidyltransferase family protein [Skermanella stibiiresistens]EWY42536.1 nucleotidyl transferase [Skermanella stibiiresistens SB22]
MPPVALLAGGLATRLRPITHTVPKAMVEVAGEPFIAHQLRLLRREGVSRVVICTGFLSERIVDFVGDGAAFGLAVSYSVDWPELLGTGGALRKALPLLGERFLVMYGDSYLDIPFAPVAAALDASGMPALMTVYRNESRWDTSNVVFSDGRIALYSKKARVPEMAHIDYGLGVMDAAVLMDHAEGEAFDLADVYGALCDQGLLAGYEVQQRFYEIGSHEGLKETEDFLRAAAAV